MNSTKKAGLIIGILVSLYLAALSISGSFGGEGVKYLKYIILMIGLMVFYQLHVKNWDYNAFMGKFISSAAEISLISGVIVAITNTLLFIAEPTWAIQKYNLAADTIGQVLLIDFVLIVEMVVLGLMSSFIIFPLHKNTPKKPAPDAAPTANRYKRAKQG